MTCAVVFGPSGSGKSSLISALVADHGFSRIRSATTAPSRVGSERIHLDRRLFDRIVTTGELILVTEVYDQRYAVLAEDFSRLRPPGNLGVVDFNYRFKRLWEAYTDVAKIVFVPPSSAELKAYLSEAGRQDRVVEAMSDYEFTMRQSQEDVAAGENLLIVSNVAAGLAESAAQVADYVKHIERTRS